MIRESERRANEQKVRDKRKETTQEGEKEDISYKHRYEETRSKSWKTPAREIRK